METGHDHIMFYHNPDHFRDLLFCQPVCQPDLMLARSVYFHTRIFADNAQRHLTPFLQRNNQLVVSEHMLHDIFNAPRRHQISVIHDPDTVAHLGKFG